MFLLHLVLDSTLSNGQGSRQNPTQFHPANQTEETITNYEQLYIYNSHPVTQQTHGPNMPGWLGNTSTAHNSSIPSTFFEQMQAKNKILVKNKEIMEK